MKGGTVLFYCQHLLGLGHWRRGAVLARALAESGRQVVFVTGGLPTPGPELGGVDHVALPPLTAADESVSALALPDGRTPDPAYLAARRAQLLAALACHDPAVVLLELFPFGRHALAFELVPLLLAVAEDRRGRGPAAPRVVVSLRDILVGKKNQPWHELSTLAVARQWIDRVLVHGSPDLIPLSQSFSLADRLGRRVVYTGYVAAPVPAGAALATGDVIVSGGGGRVAERLLHAALAARPLCPSASRRRWRLFTGPYLPADQRAELEARVAALPGGDDPPVVLETFRSDLPSLLHGAAVSVSQAGYNTVADVLASGVRAVVVPYGGSGDEQPVRATVLAARGLVKVVPEAELSPARLAAAVEDALTAPGFPPPVRLDLRGAVHSATVIGALVDRVLAARQAGRAAGRVRAPGDRRESGGRARRGLERPPARAPRPARG